MRPGQIAHLSLPLAAAALLGACGTVDGGAVELSWRLRPEPGPIVTNPSPFVACDPMQPQTNPIGQIRLTWDVDGQADSTSFPCANGNGVTRFEVPAGEALLTVTPVCIGHDADPTTYVTPAAVQRTVKVGDTVSLGAVELLLRVSSCDLQPCICE